MVEGGDDKVDVEVGEDSVGGLDEVKGNTSQSNSELAALVDATSTLSSVSKWVRKWSW